MNKVSCVIEIVTRNSYCHDIPQMRAFTNLATADEYFEKRRNQLKKLGFSESFEGRIDIGNYKYRYTDGEEVVTLNVCTDTVRTNADI